MWLSAVDESVTVKVTSLQRGSTMGRVYYSLSLLALFTLALGCQPATTSPDADAPAGEQAADAHAGHDHGDLGPHGGHLLHLEPTGAHAEWTHDDDAKLITVYLDDFDAAAIESVKFDVTIGESPSQEFPLTQGDDGWTITSDELLTHINMGEAAVVSLVVTGADGQQSTRIEAHEHHHH
jgi:hypothetical protein